MPLSFLKFIMKAKPDKHKQRSKSSADLTQGDINMLPNPTLTSTPNNKLKTKSKSSLKLLPKSKSSHHISIKEAKKNKENNDRNSASIMESTKEESATNSPLSGTENSQNKHQDSTDQCLSDSQDGNADLKNTETERKPRPTRSASCCAFMDSTQRDRRLSDIAQLDKYIEYHQRRANDNGTNTNRLLCAQMLKQSFLNLEQMHTNDLLRSKDKLDMSRSMTNLNHSASIASSHHFQKNKFAQTRRPSQWSFAQNQEPRLSLIDDNRRRSWVFVNSDDKDEDAPIQFTCNPDQDDDITDNNTRDDRAVSESVDVVTLRNFKKPKFMSKRRSVPNFLTAEIEIF